MAEHQLEFLKSRRDQRFLDLQLAVGVKQRAANVGNQMLDAWHIYCAENAAATYFVTCDYKLIRHLQSHRRTRPAVNVVTPRGLIQGLRESGHYGLGDRLRFRLTQLRERFWSGPKTGIEDLAALGDILERQGYYDEIS